MGLGQEYEHAVRKAQCLEDISVCITIAQCQDRFLKAAFGDISRRRRRSVPTEEVSSLSENCVSRGTQRATDVLEFQLRIVSQT